LYASLIYTFADNRFTSINQQLLLTSPLVHQVICIIFQSKQQQNSAHTIWQCLFVFCILEVFWLDYYDVIRFQRRSAGGHAGPSVGSDTGMRWSTRRVCQHSTNHILIHHSTTYNLVINNNYCNLVIWKAETSLAESESSDQHWVWPFRHTCANASPWLTGPVRSPDGSVGV